MIEINVNSIKIKEKKIPVIIFFSGIILLIFALLRINKWNPVDIVVLGGLGILITILSLDLYYNKKFSVIGLSGFFVALSGVFLYYFHDTYLTDNVSILYAFGLTLLLSDILLSILSVRTRLPPKEPDIEEVSSDDISYEYKKAIKGKLSDAMSTVDGLVSQLSQEKDQINDEVNKEIKTILYTLDALEIIKKTDDNKAIGMLYNHLTEHLQLRNITEMHVKIGDSYDKNLHKSKSKMPKPGLKGTIRNILTQGYFITNNNKKDVFRIAEVEVDWNDAEH